MASSPLPRFFSNGSYTSFSPILPRSSLPALLSFLEDISCGPDLTLSFDGQLYLKQRDGHFILCPEPLLEWFQRLQPDSYPQLFQCVYLDQAVQTEKETQEVAKKPEDERLLAIKDITKFAKEVHLVAGRPVPMLEVKMEDGLKVGKVKVGGEVVAEWKSADVREASLRALLAAVRLVDPSLAERWQQRYGYRV